VALLAPVSTTMASIFSESDGMEKSLLKLPHHESLYIFNSTLLKMAPVNFLIHYI
jgi:hypothetical protein